MTLTQLIVLSKQPYRESALLLSGLSPDCGKLSLVAHGAQKLSEKSYPVADLYRELDVEFEDKGAGDLFTAKRLELSFNFDRIAEDPRAFKMAGRIGGFLLRNAVSGVPQPYTYDALKSILTQLCLPSDTVGRWTLEQCSVVLKTAYLYENGLLPEPTSEKEGEFLENLVAAGIENSALPECRPDYWKTLNDWLSSLLAYHKLN